MSNGGTFSVVASLISAFFGGAIVAILNYFFSRSKTRAEIGKLEAETNKLRVETTNMLMNVEDVKSGQEEQKDVIKEIQSFLVRHLLTEHERIHLQKFETKESWPFKKDGTTRFFVDELRNLR